MKLKLFCESSYIVYSYNRSILFSYGYSDVMDQNQLQPACGKKRKYQASSAMIYSIFI